jgi:hypothetical protein
VLIMRLREPPRLMTNRGGLGAAAAAEFGAATPPFTLWVAARSGGRRALGGNLALLAAAAIGAAVVGALTDDWLQWAAIGFGFYAIASWIQSIAYKDRPLFKLTFGDPTFVSGLAGVTTVAILSTAVTFWTAPYAIRHLGLSASHAGALIGPIAAVSSMIGLVLGGYLVDRWKQRDLRAPMWLLLAALVLSTPFALLMFTTQDRTTFFVAFFLYSMIMHSFGGGTSAFAQDMVLPRMRGTSSAAFSMVAILVMLAIGPYWAGRISTATGSLATGVISVHLLAPVAAGVIIFCAMRLRSQTGQARLERALAAGEPA